MNTGADIPCSIPQPLVCLKVYLDPRLAAELARLSAENGMKRSAYLRVLLVQHLRSIRKQG